MKGEGRGMMEEGRETKKTFGIEVLFAVSSFFHRFSNWSGKSMKNKTISMLSAALITACLYQPALGARIKDMAAIKGVRSNQLVGYGLVVGLNGTGDKQQTRFTIQSLVNMLEDMGIRVDKSLVKVKNVAAVMVTANMPPFSRIGNRLDVLVSSIGDAQSLVGGTLLMTPLKGVDGNVYALAQGPISIGGVGASGGGGGVTVNHLLAGRVAGGASVEREIPMNLDGKSFLTMMLFTPDFTTARRVSEAINTEMGQQAAKMLDSGTIEIQVPENRRFNVASFLADIERLNVVPDAVAKVVVNERTGTVVVGEHVRISKVAISHGNLTISVRESAQVSQPQSFSGQGETVVTPETQVVIQQEQRSLMVVDGGATIGDLVSALNAIGVTPRDLISIFQSIKAAGALQAELEII
jgi:flagellar P-ring protein precursor FlgI